MSNLSKDRATSLQLTTLRLEQAGRVLTVRVDAPPFNFMSAQMEKDFGRLVDAVETDESVGAVIVTGAPPDRYILHFDLRYLLAAAEAAPALPRPAAQALLGGARAAAGIGGQALLSRSPLAGLQTLNEFHDTVLKLLRSPAVWIAAVNGPCAGAGLEISLFFDIRVAAEAKARFVMPELSIALNPALGGQRLAQLIGPSRAMEMMLEARFYSALEARDIGLVNRTVRDEELLDEATAMAIRYASRPRQQVAAQKRIFEESLSLSSKESLTREAVTQLAGLSSTTFQTALRRWLQMQDEGDGDSVFLTHPDPWVDGTAIDMHRHG